MADPRDPDGTFRLLFESNPLPMWAYDRATLYFLTVNDAAIEHYGYSRAEFVARRPGVTLLSAMQGSQGLELARAHRPGLVILDLHLPDMSGEDVLARLRDDDRTRDIPVVVLSADATPSQIARLRAQGAREYLTKPLDVGQLLSILDDVFRPS